MARANQGKSDAQRDIQFVRSSYAKRVIGYRVRGTTDEELIAEAQRQQKWINARIHALERAGIPKVASVGNIKQHSVAGIKTRYQAERAIARAKKLASNPLSDIRNYNKLLAAAEEEFGKGRRFKIVADPTDPYRPKLVPYGSKGYNGQPTMPFKWARDLISEFWEWYDTVGQMYFDSDDAFEALTEALEVGANPVEYAEDTKIYTQGQDIWNNYLKLYDAVYNTERASDIL